MDLLQEGVGSILHAIICPVWTLIRVVCWDAELKWRHTWEVLVIQFADEMYGAIVAAEGRVEVDQEFRVKASHFPLENIGNGLAFIVLIFALP